MVFIEDIYDDSLESCTMLVLGDIICDKYIFGKAERLSPEAPVPVFLPVECEFRLGGAANVFNNIKSLGVNAHLCGVVGNDKDGMDIAAMLNSLNNPCEYLLTVNDRPTTKKTRLVASGHPLLRIDNEYICVIDEMAETKVFDLISKNIELYDLLVVSDYKKGFCKRSLIEKIIDLFIGKGKKIIVDPKSDFYKYSGAYMIKPNLKELSEFTGHNVSADDLEMLSDICKTVLEEGSFNYIYVTTGKNGGVIFGKDTGLKIIPPFGEAVADVTGAGDTTLAALAVACASGTDVIKAGNFASFVAGISVSKMGTATVSKTDIIDYYSYFG
ncbi:MAG: PfkB family carbohydrate kinase [Defluviitaleaceae bacterium]|nr:PfkB family carbohydrate kinase [Defluviitaleaceae bacterium]